MPSKAVREDRIRAGRCVYGCGSAPGTGLACPRCAAAHAAREALRREANRLARICVDCCRAKVQDPLLRRCRHCADIQAARMRGDGDEDARSPAVGQEVLATREGRGRGLLGSGKAVE